MRATLLAAVVASGCQCLVPVGEGDGGADAGPVPACSTPADCMGVPVVTRWCATLSPLDAGFSCIDRQCVAECGDQAGQTCATEQPSECLKCPAAGSCIPPSCSGTSARFHVEDVACAAAAPLAVGTEVNESPPDRDAGECGSSFRFADGGLLGTLYLQSARGLSLESPLLGGTCVVYDLPTGAQRLLVSCPRCQISLGP